MQGENYNNDVGWKLKLEDLQTDPTFDQEGAWDKLYVKMKKKPADRKAMWYWLAAASLLCILFISTIIYFKNTNTITTTALKPAQRNYNKITHENPQSFTVTGNIVQNKKSIPFYTKNRRLAAPENIVEPHEITLIADTVTLYPENTVSQNLLLKTDSLSKSSVANVIRKKLPVVHINEIEEFTQQPADMAHNTSEHSFEFRLGAQEIFAGDAAHKKFSPGFTIIKSKTSSN